MAASYPVTFPVQLPDNPPLGQQGIPLAGTAEPGYSPCVL